MKFLIQTIVFALTVTFTNAADIYVNNSGLPGTYTTITAALSASVPNDRIFVSPFTVYTENLNIVKNITIASAVSGTRFSLMGTLTITGLPNMSVKVIGVELSSSITATSGSATSGAKAEIYIVDSEFVSITGSDYNEMHILFCQTSSTSSTWTIRHGEIRGCNVAYIVVSDGPSTGIGDTVFLVANVGKRITWSNDDNYFFIANNYMNFGGATYSCYITKHLYSSGNDNLFRNNTLVSSGATVATAPIQFVNTAGLDWSNILMYNNVFESAGVYSSTCGSASCLVATANQPQSLYNRRSGSTNYFGQSLAGDVNGATTVDALGRATTAAAIDAGAPDLIYYDIDVTRDDQGTYGGPYSIDNYTNTASGSARIFDLNMPFEIWTGQTPQVKAESTHTN